MRKLVRGVTTIPDRCACAEPEPFAMTDETFSEHGPLFGDVVVATAVATVCDRCGGLIEPWTLEGRQ